MSALIASVIAIAHTKTFQAGLGLLGLALYQVSTGSLDAAVGSVLSALAVMGLRKNQAAAEQASTPTVPAPVPAGVPTPPASGN